MSRAKLFIENFLAYGLINILNKIVPLIMLPIVTRMLPNTGDYGRFDLFNMIIDFGSSFAVLGIYDAIFREYFEKDELQYKMKVTSTGMQIVLLSSFVVMLILIIFNKAFSQIFLGDTNSTFIIVTAAIGVFLSANRNIISAPTRMQNRRTIYVVSGLSNSIAYYGLAILLVYIGLGYQGLIYGNLIASLGILLFFWILNKKEFHFKLSDKEIAKTLLKIGLPLLPVFIIYWAFNSTDKIMITHMLDVAQVGIYSIGARVASISQFIYQAFAGGWQYFAFSTMRDDDQVQLTSKIFEYLGIISFLAFIILIPFNQLIFNLLFTGDYTKGAEVFPYLFLSPLLSMLFQIAGNQFLVIKKSYYMTLSLALGVVVNIVMNFFMIKAYGIVGCSLSTLTGYAVSVLTVVIVTSRIKLLKLNIKFGLLSILMVGIVLSLFFNLYWPLIMLILLAMGLIVIGYGNDVLKLLKGFKKKR
ncbi:oligosaccharide flippase family protein [Eubacterium limosum]|uniref:Oligosaccharide flippase family protein n=1 Tax=Eubacterium limosum TaxID=1736 RepID=A0ABT5UJI4_EUBLI|nr:oligosaccharide flippase family protein [Eubacterium limosum]MCB6569762.1 oligosaccharide flippase family protein [Eubacterium limosum]MDE1469066.1 oligosaccharide flippase family protein [Eubacterium limosum]